MLTCPNPPSTGKGKRSNCIQFQSQTFSNIFNPFFLYIFTSPQARPGAGEKNAAVSRDQESDCTIGGPVDDGHSNPNTGGSSVGGRNGGGGDGRGGRQPRIAYAQRGGERGEGGGGKGATAASEINILRDVEDKDPSIPGGENGRYEESTGNSGRAFLSSTGNRGSAFVQCKVLKPVAATSVVEGGGGGGGGGRGGGGEVILLDVARALLELAGDGEGERQDGGDGGGDVAPAVEDPGDGAGGGVGDGVEAGGREGDGGGELVGRGRAEAGPGVAEAAGGPQNEHFKGIAVVTPFPITEVDMQSPEVQRALEDGFEQPDLDCLLWKLVFLWDGEVEEER